MKCPYCEYTSTWLNDGPKGDFFVLYDFKLVRHRGFERSKDLYACPKCGMVFIEVD